MALAFDPRHGVPRALRGTVLALVNAALAAAAHAAAGGGVPDGARTVLLTIGVATVGTALADRRRGPLAMLTAVAVTQVVLHLLLENLGGHHMVAPAPSVGVDMTVAHAVAALVTAALLAGAESTVFAMADVLRRVAGTLPTIPPVRIPVARRPPPPVTVPLPAVLRELLCRVTPHRGPPAVP